MSTEQFKVKWLDSGKEAQCAPNPAYPQGRDVIAGPAVNTCKLSLPYPAKRIGIYLVECTLCGFTMSITTAGRPDDPKSVTLPCLPKGHPL